MIYAINRQTKEHRVVESDDLIGEKEWYIGEKEWYTSHEWLLVHADADGWIEWNGGECPLPKDAQCEYRMTSDGPYIDIAGDLTWYFEDSTADITAYRPILNADEPAEPEAVEWDGVGLPPVGTECNCWHTGSHQGAVTVRYMGSEMCVLLNHDIGEEQCGPIEAYRFEPLRTAAQRAEEEAVEEMHPIIAEWLSDGPVEIARTLYRAGYRKGSA